MAIVGGGFSALVSAFVTALLLLINGSLTLVLIGMLPTEDFIWNRQQGPIQFALFALPLALTAIQWMLWDALCGIFTNESSEDGPWNST